MKILIILVTISLCAISQASALDLSTLSSQQLEKLNQGEIVVIEHKVPGKSWPKLEIFLAFKSPPERALALFSAFEEQTKYIPNLIEARAFEPKPNEIHVQYKLAMPWPLSAQSYIHAHQLENKRPGTYSVKWWKIRSEIADQVEGQATFSPYENGSLLHYQSFVDPHSIFAGIVRKIMVKDVKTSLLATRKFVDEQSEQKTEFSKKALHFLRNSLQNIRNYPEKLNE
ncbi:MAG: hypothetical protein Fur0010_12560 [Bdellovibrio sp.]